MFEKNGFIKTKDKFTIEREFMNGDFRAVVEIDKNGIIKGTVIDLMTNEEYLPLRIESRDGSFVSSVRNGYEELLIAIAENCYTNVLFCSEQANRLAEIIQNKYNTKPDFPWSGNAYSTYGVFRHKASRKWYALIMNVKKMALDKSDDTGSTIDIINLKADSKKIDELLQTSGVYPAYHMNHKTWISIILDDTLPDEQVLKLINESFSLTGSK